MAQKISASVPSISPEDLNMIMDTLYSLYRVREFSDVKASRFLSDLIQSLKTSGDPGLAIVPDEIPKLRDRFKKLLGIENISLLSKAIRLQRDGEKLYCDAKILSDIRPVFHDDATTKPAGAVVTHTLRLGYHERGQHKEFFMVLENIDLANLALTLERAHTKGETLRKMMEEVGLPDLGL